MSERENSQVVLTGTSFVTALPALPEPCERSPAGEERLSATFASHNLYDHLPKKGLRFRSASTKLFCSNAFEALRRAEVGSFLSEHPDRVGVYHAAELANLDDVFDFDLIAKNDGPAKVSPMRAPNTLANVASGEFSIQTGITGPNVSVSSGLTSGHTAIDVALWHLEESFTDAAVVGGVDVHSQYHQKLWEAEPTTLPRKVGHESAATIILENQGAARKRGAPILGTVLGATAGAPKPEGLTRARWGIKQLEKAQSRAEENDTAVIQTIILCGHDLAALREDFMREWVQSGGQEPCPNLLLHDTDDTFGDRSFGLFAIEEALSILASKSQVAIITVDREGTAGALILGQPTSP